MSNVIINKGSLGNLTEGRWFKNKYDLFDMLFNGITAQHKITVERNGKEYLKTCIPADISEFMMGQIREYCRMEVVGRKLIIVEVYREKVA